MRLAYITDPDITYYRSVLRGIALHARMHSSVELRIERAQTPAEVHQIDARGYDGLILGTALEDALETMRLRTPAVSVSNTFLSGRFPKVVTNDKAVGQLVAQHLLDKGYQHLAFWGTDTVFSKQRWRGFSAAIVKARGKKPALYLGDRSSLPRWLLESPRPLGLMAATDAMGSDAINACRELGWKIPNDIALVGVDDDDLYSDLTVPPLSSVRQQTDRIGQLAAECVVRLVRGEKVVRVSTVPPGPLMVRQSSNRVAATDPLIQQATQFMEQHLERGVNVADMIRALGVSRRLLELRFRETLGQTPGKELARLKLERAHSLLATTSLPLKQVAALAGFGRAARMSQVFKYYTGQSPMAYRRGFLAH